MPSHFHSATKAPGIEPREIALVERMGQHGRAEGDGVAALRALARTLRPGEQRFIGRRQPVPDLLDVIRRERAELGQRDLGEARRDADAQGAR